MSDISFSPLIAGAMRLGQWGAKLDTKGYQAFIEGCLELGVTTFDHADIYGEYTTEAEFGAVLKEQARLRDQMQLISKFGIRMVAETYPDHRIKSYDASAAHLIYSVEQSLRQLHTDHLDVMLVHRPDLLIEVEELAEAVSQLKTSGKIKAFGVSNFTPAQMRMLHQATPLFTHQFEASLLQLAPFEDGTLETGKELGILPTAWSPVGGGALFSDSSDARTSRIRKVALRLAAEKGASIDQILLAWVMRHPAGIIPVLGTSKVSRVATAMEALNIDISRLDWYELWEASIGQEVP
ncbi:MAG: aldo/keto reductase [Bacteroidota bacterium]